MDLRLRRAGAAVPRGANGLLDVERDPVDPLVHRGRARIAVVVRIGARVVGVARVGRAVQGQAEGKIFLLVDPPGLPPLGSVLIQVKVPLRCPLAGR